MNGHLTYAGATIILNSLLGKTQYANLASTSYLALSTTVPTYATSTSTGATTGALTNITEPITSANYARELIGNYQVSATQKATIAWDSTNNTTKASLNSAIKFNRATESWGTIVAWVIYSSASGGTPLAWGELENSVTVNSGEAPYVDTDNFEITLD